MDYKAELQSNNNDLAVLIEKANALPDAPTTVAVHTGTAAPTADIGADGDLYLVVTT